MNMRITQLSDSEWDQLLLKSPFSSVFHTSFWKQRVTQFIGGKADLLHCQNEQNAWLVPIYSGAPWSSQFRIGSIGYGGPLPLYLPVNAQNEEKKIQELVQTLENFFHSKCTGYSTYPTELWNQLSLEKPLFLTFTQSLALSLDPTHLFEKVLSGNVRTSIRQSQRHQVHTRPILFSEMDLAYSLLCETQKQVKAAYITPFSFFQSLCEPNSPFSECWGAYTPTGQMVAMSVLLYFQDQSFHFLHGWNRPYAPSGTNQSLIWSLIQRSIHLGCKTFNFGESHSESLREAKKRWGTHPLPILKSACN